MLICLFLELIVNAFLSNGKWKCEKKFKSQVQEQDICAWQVEKERFADDRLFPFKEERGEKKLTSIWVS